MKARKMIETSAKAIEIFNKVKNDYEDARINSFEKSFDMLICMHYKDDENFSRSIGVIEDEVSRVREGKRVKVRIFVVDYCGLEVKLDVDYQELIKVINKFIELDKLIKYEKDIIK